MPEYRELYNTVWKDVRYAGHSPEVAALETLVELCKAHGARSTLAVGCGQGHGVRALLGAGLDAHGVDVSDVALTAHPELKDRVRRLDFTQVKEPVFGQVDLVYSIDVLEHIHGKDLHGFFSAVQRQRPKVVYFEIATNIDCFGPELAGEYLHVCVRSPEWWARVVGEYFEVERLEDGRNSHVRGCAIVGRPRPEAAAPCTPESTDRRLLRNVEALANRNFVADAWKLLKSPEADFASAGLEIRTAPTGEPFGALRVGDGLLAIDDTARPSEEARDWAREQKLHTENGLVFLLGFGFGYTAEALLKVLGPQARLVVLEPYPAMLRAALEARSLDHVLSDPRLQLMVGPDEAALTTGIQNVLKSATGLRNFDPLLRTAYAALQGEDALNLTKAAMTAFDMVTRVRMTLHNAGLVWVKQTLENLAWAVDHPGMEALAGHANLDATVLVGAGPTLPDALDFLRFMQDRVPILAADSAVPKLRAAGIDPHLVIAVDPKEAPMRSASQLDPEKTGLVLGHHVHPEYRALHARFKTLCLSPYWCARLSPDGKRKTWDNMMFVGGTAADVALKMGARTLYLVGMDFAFAPNGATHVDGALPQQLMDLHVKDEWLPVAGYEHPQLRTSHMFKHYLDQFEKFVAAHPELKIVPVTTGGARIGVLEHVRPDRALEMLAALPVREWRKTLAEHAAASFGAKRAERQRERLADWMGRFLDFVRDVEATEDRVRITQLLQKAYREKVLGVCSQAIQDLYDELNTGGGMNARMAGTLKERLRALKPYAEALCASEVRTAV